MEIASSSQCLAGILSGSAYGCKDCFVASLAGIQFRAVIGRWDCFVVPIAIGTPRNDCVLNRDCGHCEKPRISVATKQSPICLTSNI
jgi:hypothetical protein